MGKDKIKILVCNSDSAGVGHFRSIWPAQTIQKNHSKDFEIEINSKPDFNNLESFRKFDIIHFHRQLVPVEVEDAIFAKLREMDIKLIMDIDDYWEPFFAHPLYHIIKQHKVGEQIVNTMKKADYVTTTTDIFAEEIKKYNKNVIVIPNAVDPNSKMWKHNDTRLEGDDRCRITWIGGSSHLDDLKLLEGPMNSLYSDNNLKGKFQVLLCGFDTRGTVTEVDNMGRQKQRPILPHETVWNKFEHIFTDNYKGLNHDPEYVNWLKKIVKKEEVNVLEKDYVRRWTLPLTQYAKHYDYCDVCLAPLCKVDKITTEKNQIINKENMFNKVKSELKIIEAGMKKKTLIAQDFGIYSELINHGENGILIKNDKKDWFKAMKRVINDKEYRDELANNLHEFVKEKYHIDNVTKERAKFYQSIVK